MKKLNNKKLLKANRQRLIRELDQVFSKYIRLKNADASGRVQCFTCGRKEHYKLMDAGHYMSRSKRATRWHEDNVKPQCKLCNQIKDGNLQVYAKKLGVDNSRYLKILSKQPVVWENEELQVMVKYFTEQIKRLNARQPKRTNKR